MAQEAQSSIHVRLPPSLHDQLREAAGEQNMSLNALVVALLAGGVGWTLDANKRGRAVAAAGPVTTHQEAPDGQHAAGYRAGPAG